MELSVKAKLCETVCFTLNTLWDGKARVETVNTFVFLFTVTYGNDFDARNELTALGIDYDEHPKNWVRGEYTQDFFVTADVWRKIRKKWQGRTSTPPIT